LPNWERHGFIIRDKVLTPAKLLFIGMVVQTISRGSDMRTRKLYQQIASTLQAIENCRKSGNTEWEGKHCDTLNSLVDDHMPSGSGIDNGTKLDDDSTPNKLIFITAFHHMNDGGMYDGWTEHTVIVTPDLASGFDLRITGRDRNDIKDYLGELFYQVLDSDIEMPGVKA
jgi:hypothetical protein